MNAIIEDRHIDSLHEPIVAMLRDHEENVDIQWPFNGEAVYNVEPLIFDYGIKTDVVRSLLPSKRIYDFDIRNTQMMRSIGINAEWRPCFLSDGLQDWVDTAFDHNDRDIDIVHIGVFDNGDRRSRVLKQLMELGYNLKIVTGIYGPEASRIMKRSKILINIHREGTLQAQEQLRLAWGIACGCRVVSEESILPSIPEPIIAQSSIDDICDLVAKELHQDGLEYREWYRDYSNELKQRTWDA